MKRGRVFILCVIVLSLISCHKEIVTGFVQSEDGIPENLELSFSLVSGDNIVGEIAVPVDRDGKFRFSVDATVEGLKFTNSSFDFDMERWRNPVLSSVYGSQVVISNFSDLDGFFFLDEDRDLEISTEGDIWTLSWKAVPFYNVFYSIRFYSKNDKIVKEVFLKEPRVSFSRKKGPVNADLKNIVSRDFSDISYVANDGLSLDEAYTVILTIFYRKSEGKTAIIPLSIQQETVTGMGIILDQK